MRQLNWKFWRRDKQTPESVPSAGPPHRPPVIRKAESIGVCETCGFHFPYDLIHNGFNDSAYAYCDACGRTVVLSGWSKIAQRVSLHVDQLIEVTVAPLLKACPCKGRFSNSASPRCPSCNHVLSADKATGYIESNAPGTARGWRWQRSWNGTYCIAIEGRVLTDWWDESKFESPDAG